MSSALRDWRTARAERLNELEGIHAEVAASADKALAQDELVWALVLRLAAEFQGFARDLHDLAAETFVTWISVDEPVGRVVSSSFTLGRKLDRGNAGQSTLADDFGLIGMDFWPDLTARHSATAERQNALRFLHLARNAIAHAELGKLSALSDDGYPMTLQTVRSWRGTLDELAISMDDGVAEHLARLFGRDRPW